MAEAVWGTVGVGRGARVARTVEALASNSSKPLPRMVTS